MRPATTKYAEHELIATARPFPNPRTGHHVMLRGERGQAFAEYALILALVVLIGMAGLGVFGAGLATMMVNTFNAVVAAF